MTTTAQSFGQEAFDFIDSLDRLYTPDSILRALDRVISRFGFETLVLTGVMPKPGETLDDLFLAGHAPDGFHALYSERDYLRFDPNMLRAIRSSHPFAWAWQDYDDEHVPRSIEVMRVLYDLPW